MSQDVSGVGSIKHDTAEGPLWEDDQDRSIGADRTGEQGQGHHKVAIYAGRGRHITYNVTDDFVIIETTAYNVSIITITTTTYVCYR